MYARSRTILSLLLFLGLWMPLQAQTPRCSNCEAESAPCYLVDFAQLGGEPEVLEGPRCVRIENVNRVRYSVILDSAVETSNGPNLLANGLGFPFPPKAKAKESSKPQGERAGYSSGEAEATNLTRQENLRTKLQANSAPQRVVTDVEKMVLNFDAISLEEFKSGDWLGGEVRPYLVSKDRCSVELWALDDQMDALEARYAQLVTEVNGLRDACEDDWKKLAGAQAQLRNLVEISDGILQGPDGAASLAAEVVAVREVISSALDIEAPDPNKLKASEAKLKELEKDLMQLPRVFSCFKEWYDERENADRYRTLEEDGVAEVAALIKSFKEDSPALTKVKSLRAELDGWKLVLGGLGAASFRIEKSLDCKYPFNQKKTTTLKLNLVDRLAKKDDKNRELTKKVVTVECPSAFSISTGVVVSGLPTRDFAFVQSRVTNEEGKEELMEVIGLQDESEEQVGATVLVNARLWQARSGYGLHASAGPVLELNNPDAAVRLGFVLGLTFSIKQDFLITAGAQLGRVKTLNGGFELGDPKGDLQSIPVQEKWQSDWALMLTYKVN